MNVSYSALKCDEAASRCDFGKGAEGFFGRFELGPAPSRRQTLLAIENIGECARQRSGIVRGHAENLEGLCAGCRDAAVFYQHHAQVQAVRHLLHLSHHRGGDVGGSELRREKNAGADDIRKIE